MDLIEKYRNLKNPRVVGLMSGTSADAIDAALVEIGSSPKLLNFISMPLPLAVRERLHIIFADKGSPAEITRMHWLLGELFSNVALEAMGDYGADLIASHGQTICHLPKSEEYLGFPVRGTLQIGEAAVIAERTGVLTVSDFRPQDLAVGGQGAPLVPYTDALLFHSDNVDRVTLNIGGMSNITVIPAYGEVIACDTGPGNALSDAFTFMATGKFYDEDGKLASQGRIIEELLEELMAHPFLSLPAPKSTGREEFGLPLAEHLRDRGDICDLIRTSLAFTARSIALHVKRYVKGSAELIVAGGGVNNPVLWRELLYSIPPQVKVRRLEELGIPSQARECMAFALLGHEAIVSRTGNLPSATGATRRVILGKITQP